MERILMAAIWVDDEVERVHLPHNIKTGMVFSGWRHHNCFIQIEKAFPIHKPVRHQGFITSTGRFVNRIEASQIAFVAGQIKEELGFLTSEDLY